MGALLRAAGLVSPWVVELAVQATQARLGTSIRWACLNALMFGHRHGSVCAGCHFEWWRSSVRDLSLLGDVRGMAWPSYRGRQEKSPAC